MSKSLSLVWKKENTGNSELVKTKILPKNKEEKFFEIQCALDGKNIILRSKSTINIYDLNWSQIHEIILNEDFLYFKTINDKINNFLILVFKNWIKCYHFIGLTATKSIEITSIGERLEQVTGNPVVDYVYLAFKKFGPHSSFIGSPSITKLNLIKNLNNDEKESLEEYYQELNIQKVSLSFVDEEKSYSLYKSKSNEIQMNYLKTIFISRVPLHIATIENFTLIPLQNGKNISDQIAENIISREKTHDLINTITNIIKFGAYEELLTNRKK